MGINHKEMKYLCLLLISALLATPVLAQKSILKKGSKAFVLSGDSEDAEKVAGYTKEKLSGWGYWKIVDNKKDADFTIDLHINTHGGVTWTSWGGKTVQLTAVMASLDGQKIWESKKYTSSPNGSNNFNSANAAANKLIKSLKAEFKN